MQGQQEWKKHPQYLADVGGLFGAPPRLKCLCCEQSDYELFYGHCRKCAESKDIPRETASIEKFHEAVESGTPVVVEEAPSRVRAWWHPRRWLSWLAGTDV